MAEDPGGPDLAAISLARARSRARSTPRRAALPQQQRRSGSAPDGRDPQLIGSALGRLIEDRGWEQATAGASLIARWPEIAGADIAEHVSCEAFTPGADGVAGELVLQADSTAWATQLRLLQPQLLGRIAEVVGSTVVGRLRILGPAAPSWRSGPRHVSGRGPRDTYG